MKCLVLFVVTLVGLSMAGVPRQVEVGTYPRGCRYAAAICVEECPVGTHAYGTGCSRLMPEATCDKPIPILEEGIICDFSDCYCDPPTVRNEESKKCVHLHECPKKNKKEE